MIVAKLDSCNSVDLFVVPLHPRDKSIALCVQRRHGLSGKEEVHIFGSTMLPAKEDLQAAFARSVTLQDKVVVICGRDVDTAEDLADSLRFARNARAKHLALFIEEDLFAPTHSQVLALYGATKPNSGLRLVA